MKNGNTFDYRPKKTRSYYVLTAILTIILVVGASAITYFVPNFWFAKTNEGSWNYAYHVSLAINSPDIGIKTAAILNCIGTSCLLVLGVFGGWIFIRYFICSIVYEKWLRKYMDYHTSIINSCDVSTFTDKVAIVIPTCNDFSPNTILQTANQTYKNCDVWICDDSSKPEFIDAIKKFADEHGFHVLRRSDEHKKAHPTKAGNLFYFVEQVADKYDYILENDSSSVITSHFVQNALCYFHSPLLKDKKVGGIVCTGQFYGTKNLISRINAIQSQWNEASCFGAVIRLTGHPIFLQGWGTFFASKTLKSIPLEKVECPCCDMARGMYLSLHGYDSFWCPFDFSGKIGVQNMEGWLRQRLKWNGGDVWMFKNNLVNGRYRGARRNISVRSISYPTVIFIPIAVIAGFINSITAVCLNIVFVNLTSFLLLVILALTFIIAFLIAAWINKTNLKVLICVLLLMACEGAILFRRFWQIFVRSLMFNKWSSGAVTTKTDVKTPVKLMFKRCATRFVWIAICIGVCVGLQFGLNAAGLPRDNGILWTNIFVYFAMPSCLYILITFVGEIPCRIGWSHKMDNFDIAPTDFRYKYIKQSEIWKKQKEAN